MEPVKNILLKENLLLSANFTHNQRQVIKMCR